MNTMTANTRSERLARLGLLQEPLGYVDGGDVYEYVRCNPVGGVDPLGLAATTQPTTNPTTRPSPIRVGFIGLGPNDTYGDTVNQMIMTTVGARSFDWEDQREALLYILRAIDKDGNKKIEANEVSI